MALPNHANVVIVGGGIAGCSIAYHLTKIGITDVVLLERKQLTCGTTWHAAGLVGQLRATRNLTELAKYTADLYHSLEAETGQATGFKQNGSISVAKTAARLEELRRGASMGKTFGLRIDELTHGRDQGALAAARGRRPRRRHLPAQGRPDQPDRHHAGAGQGREAARRADLSRTRSSGASASRTAVRPAWNSTTGSSRRTPWCCAPACGRTVSPPTSEWRCRCTRPSTSTSSPSRSRTCRATCRCCACRTSARTTRKTPASC